MFKVTIKSKNAVSETGKRLHNALMSELGVAFRHFTTFAEAEKFARPFIGSKNHDVVILKM